jgi:hypothetical protein
MAQNSDEETSDSVRIFVAFWQALALTRPQLFTIADVDNPEKLIRINFYIANDLPTFLRQWLTTVIEVLSPSFDTILAL